ncbi:RING/U-box superfamily protein [Forsythia ovata]|uniref:RING/U-box superfamily protein n=1 Tax=Forsythia ovata TaxID=205694 RepID=A0ABD1Q918_9LAMI
MDTPTRRMTRSAAKKDSPDSGKKPPFHSKQKDLEATTPDSYRRRTLGLRRRRYNSSKSIESLFSYQFLQMITLARQTQSTVLEHDNQSIDGDGATRLVQFTSTCTIPSGSRRWRRVFSDTESDGFDSFYGENESNVSFRRYRYFHGEDDTISYTIYGGDSDASIDEFGANLFMYTRKYPWMAFQVCLKGRKLDKWTSGEHKPPTSGE